MTDEELTQVAYELSNKYEDINTLYISLIARHVKEIGKLSPSDVHIIEQYMRMSANIEHIKNQLVVACGLTMKELDKLFDKLILDEYSYSKPLYNFRNLKQTDLTENKDLRMRIKAIRKLTRNSLLNVSNTTIINKDYKLLVDKCIHTVSNGLTDYNSVIRRELQQAGQGMRVTYESGLTRRLDSAVRMNILEGVRQVNQAIREQSGEIFQADGYEISAHALCAPDHLDIQGKQFAKGDKDIIVDGKLYKSYDVMNNALQRPIGTLNCRHSIFPIILGISQPVHTEEVLNQYKENSNKKINVNGKERTKYECTQLMRNLETQMRTLKEQYIKAREQGDKEAMTYVKKHLTQTQAKYRNLCKASGLKTDYKRAYVPRYQK